MADEPPNSDPWGVRGSTAECDCCGEVRVLGDHQGSPTVCAECHERGCWWWEHVPYTAVTR